LICYFLSCDITDVFNYAQNNVIRTKKAYPNSAQTFNEDRGNVTAPACMAGIQDEAEVTASVHRPLISSYGLAIHSCQQRENGDAYSTCDRQDEAALARFAARQPVSAVIDANDRVFNGLYSGYIIQASDCSSVAGAGSHTVIIVGLLTDATTGKKVWKIQNSYGSDWGDNGYAYLEYGYNTCGIANYNHYVQTTCEIPADLHPLPRPTSPRRAPRSVALRKLKKKKQPKRVTPIFPLQPDPLNQFEKKKEQEKRWWQNEKQEQEDKHNKSKRKIKTSKK